MEHVAAIMLLVGCSYGNVDCQELPAPTVAYRSVEDCQSVLRSAVDESGVGYKITYGKCTAIDPAVFEQDASIVWDITSNDELKVTVETDDEPALRVASNEKTVVRVN